MRRMEFNFFNKSIFFKFCLEGFLVKESWDVSNNNSPKLLLCQNRFRVVFEELWNVLFFVDNEVFVRRINKRFKVNFIFNENDDETFLVISNTRDSVKGFISIDTIV